MRLKNKSVLVYGLGDSGRAVIKILQKHHAYISCYDDDISNFNSLGFEKHPELKKYDFVVVSPGVKCIGNPLLKVFKDKKILVMSELDFAYKLSKGKIIGITGTNGKTTVCMLVNKILKEAGYNTFLCGNIGLPFSSICESTKRNSIIVCEVSSFQLESSNFFNPNIACILNITPDHIDRHGNFENYKNCKCKIAERLKHNDKLILNLDDENAKNMIFYKKYAYFSKKTLKKGVFLKNNYIYKDKNRIISTDEIKLLGEKNLENVLAAISICSNFKIKNNVYKKVIRNFVPALHRMQTVGKIDGKIYIDDSKATNVGSTVACLNAFSGKKIILLLGGKGKGASYEKIFFNPEDIIEVVCFGEDGKTIKDIADKYVSKVTIFEKFKEAVEYCKKIKVEDCFCILSPACSSFDEFSSYVERGEKFVEILLNN